jgi:hypothetical protein
MHEPDVENISGPVSFVSNPPQQLHQRSGTSMDHTYATPRQADGSWMACGMHVVVQCLAGGCLVVAASKLNRPS